jgi:hypothetical protein
MTNLSMLHGDSYSGDGHVVRATLKAGENGPVDPLLEIKHHRLAVGTAGGNPYIEIKVDD